MASSFSFSFSYSSLPDTQDADDANDRQYDGIVVLAGGLTASGGVPEWVKGRLEAAADLHSRSPGSVILVTGGGTPHKPPILHDRSGHVIHESTVCADYLVSELGVSPNSVLKETSSYDTIGNAYFSLTIHAAPLGWSEVCTVTSAFHMPRALASFRQQSNLQIIPVACDYRLDPQSKDQPFSWQELLIDLVPNSGSLNQTTQVLNEHLGLLVYKLRGQA